MSQIGQTDLGINTLSCALNIEWLDNNGCIKRKLTYKSATLQLLRNNFRDINLEITGDKAHAVQFCVKNVKVHNKFMSTGKASITFIDAKCTLFLSNAPPNSLQLFLRTMFVKISGDVDQGAGKSQPLSSQLLSNLTKATETISPVTLGQLKKAKAKVLSKTETTPTLSPASRKKRKMGNKGAGIPAAKKLYTSDSEIVLNSEQKTIFDACIRGQNIFFTGSAGTGKSYLLRKIIQSFPPSATVASAPTGVAACHIGGVTLHSFAGIGNGEASLQQCYQLASRPAVAQAWKRCQHLIIDEISMVDGTFFEKIEAVARYVRKNDKPFGGIQLILCGDFFQLPPVNKTDNKRFCFESAAWNRCVHHNYELQKIHRQSDQEFIDILNNIRIGNVTESIMLRLSETKTQEIEGNAVLATRLCSHTNEVKLINDSKLNHLNGDIKIFNAQDSNESMTKILDQQLLVPYRLELKIGAQVMLLKTLRISSGLVNGARGVVVKFDQEQGNCPIVKFKNGQQYLMKSEKWMIKLASGDIISRRQIPLQLAWAFSIHKSQGLTLDCVELSLSRVFEAGQAYVALSRAKSLNTLRVLDIDKKLIWANPLVLQFYRKLRNNLKNTMLIPLGRPKSGPKLSMLMGKVKS